MGQRAGKPLCPPEFPISLRLDTWEKSKCLQSGNKMWYLAVKDGIQDLLCKDLENWKAGMLRKLRGRAHPVWREAWRTWRSETATVVLLGSPVLRWQDHGPSGNWSEFEPPLLSLPSWVTWGDLLNLCVHQPPQVVNEDNHIYLTGLSGDSVRAGM